MPKFFVCADIHSYFHIFYDELIKKGYDKDNPDHYIICCGDYFDRGPEPLATYDFFMNSPRTILIKGNHEDLMTKCLERRYWMYHDAANGTVATILAFGQRDPKDIDKFKEACSVAEMKLKYFFDRMVNYFETEKYIFVHGWIPCHEDSSNIFWNGDKEYYWNPNWREAHDWEWDNARWLNGMKMAKNRVIEPDKTIVCGHWHTSWGHCRYEHHGSEFEQDADFSPYVAEGIIAIDACTAFSGKANILVIEDNFLEGGESWLNPQNWKF